MATQRSLEAFDPATGAVQWALNIDDAGVFGRHAVSFAGGVTYDGSGLLLVPLTTLREPLQETRLVAFDVRTGAIQRSVHLPHGDAYPVVDRLGNVFVGSSTTDITAFDARGSLLWQRHGDRAPQATHRGRMLLHKRYSTLLMSTSNGSTLSTLRDSLHPLGAVWSDEALFWFRSEDDGGTHPASLHIELIITDNTSAQPSSRALSIGNREPWGWLTQRQTILFLAEAILEGPARLIEVNARAQTLMDCELSWRPGRSVNYRSTPVLSADRWAVVTGEQALPFAGPRLEVWAVPGYQPASNGWISPHGGPGLDGRAR